MWPCASPLCLLTPPVLRFSRRITSRFDVLGQSLIYLNPLVWLVSDLLKFPRVSLSLPSRALKSSLLLKSQRRFSAAEQVRVCLVYEDPPLRFPFCVYLVSLTTSSIALTSLYMRGLILIRLITCLLLYISSISTYPWRKRTGAAELRLMGWECKRAEVTELWPRGWRIKCTKVAELWLCRWHIKRTEVAELWLGAWQLKCTEVAKLWLCGWQIKHTEVADLWLGGWQIKGTEVAKLWLCRWQIKRTEVANLWLRGWRIKGTEVTELCVYLISLTTSSIALTSLYTRGLILIRLITCLLLYISSISTYLYLPCYSLRDPPPNHHISLHRLGAEYSALGTSGKLATIYTSARDQAELSVAGFRGSWVSRAQASEKPIKSRRASSKGTRMHSCWQNET